MYAADSPLGVGAFAGRDFATGELILHFSGPEITTHSAKRYPAGHTLQINSETCVELDSPGVFLNHSCQPNTGVRGLFSAYALRPIERGEELRYDYSTTVCGRHWKMRCGCGASGCRGEIECFFRLPESLQERYVEAGIVQAFIVDQWRSAFSEYARNTEAESKRVPQYAETVCS